jgi:hypothetical protein
MKTYQLFVHFHKEFPFNLESDWVTPTGYESDLNLGMPYTCLSAFEPSIKDILPPAERQPETRVGYLGQTISTEYWILKHVTDINYVGVTGYRRYPMMSHNWSEKMPIIETIANKENLSTITNNGHIAIMNDVLNVYDVIVPRALYFPVSIEDQYLESQRKDLWLLFIACLVEVVPEYKYKINWFKISYNNFFFGPMGMTPLGIFKEYADIYSRIIALMCQRAEFPFVPMDQNAIMKTDRWVGYLAERFYPFFLFVNKLSYYNVPTIYLHHPDEV